MKSPSALLLFIGCVVFLPKAVLGRQLITPLYVWRESPTSSPTAVPSYQPSLRPSVQPTSSLRPSSSPSMNPAFVLVANNYMTSEAMEERPFGFWKTLLLISSLSCFVGVGIGLYRNHDCLPHKNDQDNKQQGKRETPPPAKGEGDGPSVSAKGEELPSTASWLFPFWKSEPSKDEPSLPTRDESISDVSSFSSSSFSTSFTPSSYSGSSVSTSSIVSPSSVHDSPHDKFDVEAGPTQPASEASDPNHLVPQRGKQIGTAVKGKLGQAKTRFSTFGNRMKGVTMAKSKQETKSEQGTKSEQETKITEMNRGKQETKRGDQIDDGKSIATVADKVSSAVTWGLDWIEVLAFGEEEEPTRPPSQVVVTKNTSSSLLNHSYVQPTPRTKEDSYHKRAVRPNATKMKTQFKAMVAQKALEMKVKAREKKWQFQQAKAAAAESKRKEEEVTETHKVEIQIEREAQEIETKLRMMNLTELNLNEEAEVELEKEKDIRSAKSHDHHDLGTALKSKGSGAGTEKAGRTLTGLRVYGSSEMEFMENLSEEIGDSDGNVVDAIEEKSAGEYFVRLYLRCSKFALLFRHANIKHPLLHIIQQENPILPQLNLERLQLPSLQEMHPQRLSLQETHPQRQSH